MILRELNLHSRTQLTTQKNLTCKAQITSQYKSLKFHHSRPQRLASARHKPHGPFRGADAGPLPRGNIQATCSASLLGFTISVLQHQAASAKQLQTIKLSISLSNVLKFLWQFRIGNKLQQKISSKYLSFLESTAIRFLNLLDQILECAVPILSPTIPFEAFLFSQSFRSQGILEQITVFI